MADLEDVSGRSVADALLWQADRLPDSPWNEHFPLFAWLVGVVQPIRVLQLGAGDSAAFRALCQVIERHGLNAEATLVDSWRADERQSWLASSRYEELQSFCAARYGSRAKVLRIEPAAAIDLFEPRSLDLLQVATTSSISAGPHGLSDWIEKFRPGGVLIVGGVDGSLRQDDPWKLWQEIAERLPSVFLDYGVRVGVAQVPGDSGATVIEQLSEPSGEFVHLLQALGERIEFHNLLGAGPTTASGLRHRVQELLEEKEADSARRLRRSETEIERLRSRLAFAMEENTARAMRISSLENDADVLRAKITFHAGLHERELAALRERNEAEVQSLQVTVAEQQAAIAELQMLIAELHESTSWRITSPIRAIKRLIDVLRG